MSMLKDCYLLCFFLLFTIYLVIKCHNLKNEILSQKEAFNEILGHDLRVPVIAQIRGLDLISKNIMPQDDRCFLLKEVYNSCVYTLDMINMLVKTYNIENGDINLKYENFSLYEIFNSILNGYEDIIADKALDVTCNLNEIMLTADKEAIYKALKILIHIMLQYSERNSKLKILISHSRYNLDLTLSYAGQRLSYDEYHRIFSQNSKFSAVGHGIQMYLCKKIIDLHKGKIKLISESQNKSYSFKISIPRQRCAYVQGFWYQIKRGCSLISLQNLI